MESVQWNFDEKVYEIAKKHLTNAQYSIVAFQTAYKMTSQPSMMAEHRER